MNQQFLKEIEKGSKSALVKKRIITHYIYNGSSTIPDLSKELDLSVPTVTKFIGEMCDDGYMIMANWRLVADAIPTSMGLIRNPVTFWV